MPEAFVALGANLGDPAAQMAAALGAFAPFLDIRRVSSLYRTEPVGMTDQPWFLNAVVAGRAELEPEALMARLAALEAEMGRTRSVPMGPRTIDLDLLLYGDAVLTEPGLSVPHPSMTERRFVLEPLAEIAPDIVHPVTGRTVRAHLADLPPAPVVERIAAADWPPALRRGP